MKKSKFTPNQIVGILKEYESGKTAEELSRARGISKAALYSWRKKYGGMEATDLQRLKALEEENHKLEPMYAELALDYQMAKDIVRLQIIENRSVEIDEIQGVKGDACAN